MATSWGYRIIRDKNGDLSLHEISHNGCAIVGYTSEPATFTAYADEGRKGLVRTLKQALREAKANPVLEQAELDRHLFKAEVGRELDAALGAQQDG
jgi:hypothetical protein